MSRGAGLRAEGLHVALGGRAVLRDVSLAVRRGEVTAIIGPNGAGKSTLLACLSALRLPDTGAVTLDGAPLAALPPRVRARRIAVMPQTPEIAWGVDVEALVGLGRLPHLGPLAGGLGAGDRQAVERALAATALLGLRRRVALTLSGGERARALLARALAGEPEWLLADEPLTGLDPGHQFDACDLFRRAAADGAGVVLTLHDLALTSRVADRLLVLHEGAVVADGAPAEVLDAALLARVYGVAARVERAGEGLQVELLGRTAP